MITKAILVSIFQVSIIQLRKLMLVLMGMKKSDLNTFWLEYTQEKPVGTNLLQTLYSNGNIVMSKGESHYAPDYASETIDGIDY
jgi:hypothetical protein